jgi:pilus assembly protein CpaD
MDTMSTNGDSRPRRSRTTALLLAAGLLAALAGCNSVKRPEIVGSVPVDYRETHPIAIEEQLATMDIPVGLDTARLSAPVRSNIAGFAEKFAASGSATIAIVLPSGSPNERIARGISLQVEDVLVASGVPARAIEHRVYRAGPEEPGAPIRIAYNRVAAHTEPCGPWPDQTSNTTENRNYHAFGCATQTNLAAIVANPLDLLYPRATTPPDATRRAVVLDNYEQGKKYGSDYSAETGGAVATGVGTQ